MKRLQHPGFGEEIQSLLGSNKHEDKKLAGVIKSKLKKLDRAYSKNEPLREERSLKGGSLGNIRYLKIYKKQQSARLYYTIIGDVLYCLHLNPSKTDKAMKEGTRELLRTRYEDTKANHDHH